MKFFFLYFRDEITFLIKVIKNLDFFFAYICKRIGNSYEVQNMIKKKFEILIISMHYSVEKFSLFFYN